MTSNYFLQIFDIIQSDYKSKCIRILVYKYSFKSIHSLIYHLFLLIIFAAGNTDYLEKLEGLCGQWSKQIEQVLAESEQMRREADDIGPTAELNYWKTRMAKFNKYVLVYL